VWLHGSQSSSTGFSRSTKRQVCAIICWLAHSMRCVLITTLGEPVEPEVSRYLAWWSGSMAAKARCTSGPSAASASWLKLKAPGSLSAARSNTSTASMPAWASAAP
jgi:hypothetical protein